MNGFIQMKKYVDHLEVYNNLGLEMFGIYNELFLEFKMDMK